MQTKRTRRPAPHEQRTIHYDELEARGTMSRLQRVVDDGNEADLDFDARLRLEPGQRPHMVIAARSHSTPRALRVVACLAETADAHYRRASQGVATAGHGLRELAVRDG
jgi:hypothetical protein